MDKNPPRIVPTLATASFENYQGGLWFHISNSTYQRPILIKIVIKSIQQNIIWSPAVTLISDESYECAESPADSLLDQQDPVNTSFPMNPSLVPFNWKCLSHWPTFLKYKDYLFWASRQTNICYKAPKDFANNPTHDFQSLCNILCKMRGLLAWSKCFQKCLLCRCKRAWSPFHLKTSICPHRRWHVEQTRIRLSVDGPGPLPSSDELSFYDLTPLDLPWLSFHWTVNK